MDADRALIAVTVPGGRSIAYDYDASGRPTGSSDDGAKVTAEYADASGRVTRLARTPGHDTRFGYDGPLLTSERGTDGDLDYGHDADMLLSGARLKSGSDVANTPLARDADGLETRIGPFTVARAGPSGAPSALSDGTATATIDCDALTDAARRTLSVAGAAVYDRTLAYDRRGRIARKTEHIGVATRTYDYVYDDDGRLERVERNGAAVERYEYDLNGNRTSRRLGGQPAETADFDGQDRITRAGAIAYSVDDAGFLLRRGDETFTYGARGELLEARVGTQTIEYDYDALGRRVTRTEGDQTTRYFYANPRRVFELSAVRAPWGELTALHYGPDGALLAFERRGARY